MSFLECQGFIGSLLQDKKRKGIGHSVSLHYIVESNIFGIVTHHSRILGGNNRIMVIFQMAKNSIHAPKSGVSRGNT